MSEELGKLSKAEIETLFKQILDAVPDMVLLKAPGSRLVWANAAWLAAVDAETLEAAREKGLDFDKGAEALAREALTAGAPREVLRWIAAHGRRRAYRIVAAPTGEAEIMVRLDRPGAGRSIACASCSFPP